MKSTRRAVFSHLRAIVQGGLVLSIFVTGTLAQADIQWSNGGRVVAQPKQPDTLERVLVELGERQDKRRVVVHFDGPLSKATRAALNRGGLQLLDYLGGNAFFATLTPRLDASALGATEGLLDVGEVEAAVKLHPDLALGLIHPWSIVERPGKADGDGTPMSGEGSALEPVVAVYVLFHRDFDAQTGAVRLVTRHGGKVQSRIRSINAAVVHLPADRIEALAQEDAVMYIEPPLPKMSTINDSNRTRVGAETAAEPPYGLDGAGVTVLVYDGGQMFAHGDFGSRLTIGASDTDGISDHATHVGGTIGGDGAGSAGQFRGMAPAVEFVSYGFEQEGGLVQGFLYTDPGDLEADYSEAIALHGADLSNNSIGTNTAPNGFPCEWEGNYGATGALIDAIAAGSLGAPFRIVWANGNERGSGACGSTYVTTAPPACAKNHITVGALNSDTDSVTSFSSWGPTDDGRIKPDVSGPGCESGGDGGVTSTGSSGGYNVKCGTSMASPTVAGVSALLLQQFRLSNPGAPDFRNATLKAILANTAQDIVDPGPDYQSGYGSVRVVPAVDTILENRIVEAEVAQGATYSFIVLVGPDDGELKVTLAWDDPPGTPNVDPVLVNDLDLRVLDASGTPFHPWTLNPANPSAPAVRTQRDGVNNIEQVVIDNPPSGAYRVEVTGFNIAEGPAQSFGVAASPTLINCSPSGLLAVGANRVSCSGDLGVQVIDCDLNTDDEVTETVSVSVSSTSEPGGETLLLTESAPEAATFVGSLPLATADAAGVLQIAEGDTITALYIDADDGEGGTDVPVTRNVIVDCTGPSIESVTVTQINPRDAETAVTVDEPARVTVRYGTACGAPTASVTSFALTTLHDLRLNGLTDDTTYYFTAEAVDEAGNSTFDDNSGTCYSFATPQIPDFLTEQLSAGLDLVGTSVMFVPNGSNDFYAYCSELLAGALPTDPAGGTDSGLGDDQPTSFNLPPGETVQLYGVQYSTIHVGPNGYVTFGQGDSDYTESFADHFDLPRVSALFDDLNPGAGGSVSWRFLSDRVAVTWDAVPEYSSTNSNTFQIELFYDARIRMSWLQIDSTDAIAGLSAGNGVDPDFFESDLSEGAGCDPTAPAVQNLNLTTGDNTALRVDLLGSDDGHPLPLTYRIDSLPITGTLTDIASGRAIVSAPHDLTGGASAVMYTPDFGFQGPDGFVYRADDGGTAPEGGPSAPGTVDILVGGPQVLHAFLLDDQDPGWSATGGWAFGTPTGGGSNGGDPSQGHTGSNVYGYNLAGDYTNDMSEETLTSPPIDLSSVSGSTLAFQRWLGIEASSADRASVLLSTDGATWRKMWSHNGPAIADEQWFPQNVDLASFADGEPTVQLRWVMGDTDAAGTSFGWNLDDIRIFGTASCGAAPGNVDNLRFVGAKDTLVWDPPAADGGATPYFDLLRSDDTADFSTGVCVEAYDGSDTFAVDGQSPGLNQLYGYLVRARNACGAGPVGDGRVAGDCVP